MRYPLSTTVCGALIVWLVCDAVLGDLQLFDAAKLKVHCDQFDQMAQQVLARPEVIKEGGEGKGAAATAVSDEAVAGYTSSVLKALFSTEISKQLSTDRT